MAFARCVSWWKPRKRPLQARKQAIIETIVGIETINPYRKIHTLPPLLRFSATWLIYREGLHRRWLAWLARQINATH
jgi:hypothetical protein